MQKINFEQFGRCFISQRNINYKYILDIWKKVTRELTNVISVEHFSNIYFIFGLAFAIYLATIHLLHNHHRLDQGETIQRPVQSFFL